ncbi:hypothetical protein OKW21_005140 [Catalinimonas alkaloidigena]|uniref:putative adhesin n=1 Tax=Catalinimonas alkaloidigena TaxID=1075417 RepID=UPI002405F2BC|nr:hypothetical protein [Catalinimonas alkaloidigena]MDF9799877.1 hypothetical protein [Catalinimonas alkaloidigena]
MMRSIGDSDNMYLFLGSGDESVYATSLVISAHGGIRKTRSPEFTVPYGALQFYSEHGDATYDEGIDTFIGGGNINKKQELITQGKKCYNYDLTKYQGKHNKANETYESIQTYQETAKNIVKAKEAILSSGKNVPGAYANYTNFDVLTIRNRRFQAGVNLENALQAVGLVHKYTIIHCYFCRSFYFY